ncbi:hypothetical protein FJW05_10440 [Mesorhizobium sp. B2-9-1]|uniref:hypothetical protein n=1 Tax=Mesorhizobium sp. B2-9-1 TaxID=2589898 RepID=UPI00112C63BE|nr:hypothetical protein [Mesorhizobium sp. B2-9-1]TPI47397.1 hypothetical protein FJW05_10440 [Mesorhizobium sp. B2-9-1]
MNRLAVVLAAYSAGTVRAGEGAAASPSRRKPDFYRQPTRRLCVTAKMAAPEAMALRIVFGPPTGPEKMPTEEERILPRSQTTT